MQVPLRKTSGLFGEDGRFRRETDFSRGNAAAMDRKETTYLFPADATLLDFVEQRLVAHAQLFRGAAAIPWTCPQGVLDVPAFGLERRGLRDIGEPRAGRRHRDRHLGLRFLLLRRVGQLDSLGLFGLVGGHDRSADADADAGTGERR